MNIIKYTADKAEEWNSFVEKSKNGTFLIDRRYMDYHSDRFSDFSLMFYDDKERLCGLLPANRINDTIYSHQGLTYGSLITNDKISATTVLSCFSSMLEYLKSNGIEKIIYKAIPYIYHKQPAEEDLYALFTVCNARLIKRDISSAIPLSHPLRFIESRRSGIRKAEREGLNVVETSSFKHFWNILETNLMAKHGVKPVHSLQEIELLKSRFPNNIKLFVVTKEDKPIGGTLLYLTTNVVHTQYISASEEGKHCGAIDILFDRIIHSDLISNYQYLDFGKSNENDCYILNDKLLFQKEGFGGRAVCYDTYEVTIDKF